MANVNSSTMSDSVKTLYERRLLIRALARLVHGKWGKVSTISRFGSIEFRRFGSLSVVSSALTEGVTPTENDEPTITTTTVTPLWYGSWIGHTDKLEVVMFDEIISETTGLLGEQAGLSFDTLVRNALTDGATKQYSGAATTRLTIDATNDKIGYADLLDLMATLESANALPCDGGNFPLLCSPWTFATLMQDASFLALFVREGSSPLRSGKMGSILNYNIYVTSNARTYSSNTTVYDMLAIGQESFGLCGFSGSMVDYSAGFGAGEYDNLTGRGEQAKNVEIIVKDLGSSGTNDPLNQRGSIGWKATHEEVILNSAFIVSLEHATVNSA